MLRSYLTFYSKKGGVGSRKITNGHISIHEDLTFHDKVILNFTACFGLNTKSSFFAPQNEVFVWTTLLRQRLLKCLEYEQNT